MPPISGPDCTLAVRAGFAGAGGVGWEDPGADDTGARGAYPADGTGADSCRPGPGGAWADPFPGTVVHQTVCPGGVIVWLSCGIGPVPATPSGADSGGGAGSEPAAIRAVSAWAAAVAAAAAEVARDGVPDDPPDRSSAADVPGAGMPC